MKHQGLIRAIAVVAVLAVAGGWQAGAAEPVTAKRVGHAYAQGSSELLYREIHWARREDGRPVTEKVTYRGPEGRVIATKTIDYRRSQRAPAFRLVMTDPVYHEGMASTDEGLRAFVRAVGEERERSGAISGGADLVVDAGFDRLMAERLADLKAGRRLTFRFLVPSRLAAYDFRAQKVERTRVLGEPAIHVRMEPAGFLLRWLAEPVDVFYHWEQGRLLRYEGPSNLRDAEGDNPLVRVDFPAADRGVAGP